jgi:hypothetical protein
MKGIPPKDPKDCIHFIPNSQEASPEGAINNEVSYEIGSSTPLEEFILLINPLFSVVQNPHFL